MALVTTRRFTVDEYYKMAEAGILGEDDRVELIEGEIVQMPAIGSPHASCVTRLDRQFFSRAGESVIVRVQNPVHLSEHSEPEPDLAIVKAREDFYARGHPEPGDVLLLVEVSDTTYDYDHSIKGPLYARAGIPEFWIVNLEAARVEVMLDPAPDGYQTIRQYGPGERIAPQHLPQAQIEVRDILPS